VNGGLLMAARFKIHGLRPTVQDYQKYIVDQISGLSQTPRLDAQVLLAHIMGKSRAWLLAHPEENLTPTHQATLQPALAKLVSGTPLPYILGDWEFYNLSFRVNPAVLIPRPETELLVETALNWLREHPTRRTAADIGTGSGCLAISMAANIPNIHVTATDISESALKIAQSNATRHQVSDRIQFIQSDLFSALPVSHSTFDLVAANLPYIPTQTLRNLDVFGREPTLALDGGPAGLDLIRKLLQTAPPYLAPGGVIFLEIEASQGSAAVKLAHKLYQAADINLYPDFAGQDRLVKIETHP